MRPTHTARSIVIPLKEPAWRRWFWPLIGCLTVVAMFAAGAVIDEHDLAVHERRAQQLRDAHEQGRQQGLREASTGLTPADRMAYHHGWIAGLELCHGRRP